MKLIDEGGQQANWNKDLINQLGFIREKLRFPLSKKTLGPLLIFIGSIPSFVFILYILGASNNSNFRRLILPKILMISMILIPALVSVSRFYQTLKFVSIPTQVSIASNIHLLKGFLKTHHFAFGQHPEAPEVFMIMSKDFSTLQNEREVVIFIADDNRILINSHFTQNKVKTVLANTHRKEIEVLLSTWLENQKSFETGIRPI